MAALSLWTPPALAQIDSTNLEVQTEPVSGDVNTTEEASDIQLNIDELLAHFEHEPSIDELMLTIGGAAIDVSAVERLARRARLSALLPELRTFIRRGQGVDLDERSGNLQTSTDDSLTLGATATWRLSQLVFRRGEVTLAREAARRDDAMQRRRHTLIRAYFERRRLQLEQLVLGEELERAMAIMELTAVLDALTEGAFSRLSASPSSTPNQSSE